MSPAITGSRFLFRSVSVPGSVLLALALAGCDAGLASRDPASGTIPAPGKVAPGSRVVIYVTEDSLPSRKASCPATPRSRVPAGPFEPGLVTVGSPDRSPVPGPRAAAGDEGPGILEDEPSFPAPMTERVPPLSRPPPAEVAAAASGDGSSLRDELARSGVRVTGAGADDAALERILTAVRQFAPGDVGPLVIEVTGQGRQAGVLGTYFTEPGGLGRIVLFNSRVLHVVLHEIAHHVTLVTRPEVSRRILEVVAPDGRVALRDLPSRYARTSQEEFLAEWVSNVREITTDLPGDPAFRLRSFDPQPAGVQVTEPMFARR